MQRVAKLWRSPCQSMYVETLHKSMIIVAVGAWSVIMRKANSLLTKQNIAIHSMRLTMSQRGSMIGRLREVEVESAYDS